VPRYSANLTMMFGERPFPERFGAAARAGFAAVEFVSPYEHDAARLGELLAEHQLAVSVFNLPPGDWAAGDRGVACDPRRVGEFQDGVARALEYADALGCPRLHAMAGLRPAGVGEDELRATYVANLRFAAKELAARSLDLLVEAINDRDMPGYYVTTSRQAFDLMDEVAAPNLHFQLDVYHLHVMGEDVARVIEERLPRIGHVQIADAPGRHEPGTGEIDFARLLPLLGRLDYPGWVGCEYRPLTTTEAGLGWLEAYGGT
jgi:hydroxypyruvate isomerase